MSKLTQLTEEEMENVLFDARAGDLETIKAIFEQEVEESVLPDIKDPQTKATMFHMSAANGHTELLQYLISLLPKDQIKQVINSVNQNGNTPLHWAAYNGHLDVVKTLCDNGGDPFLRNEYDHDVFYEAGNNNQEKVEDYLLERYGEELEEEMDERDTQGEAEQGDEDDEEEVQFNEGSEIVKVGEEDAIAVEKLRKEAEKLNVDN